MGINRDGLELALQPFDLALGGLYELRQFVSPHVEILDENMGSILKDNVDRELDLLSPEDRTQVAHKLRDLGEILTNVSDGNALETGPLSVDVSDMSAPAQDALWAVVSATGHKILQPSKHRLVLESIVATAVATFEVLVRALVHLTYEAYPGLISKTEKEFSLGDLERFASPHEAVRDAIDRRVESVLYRGFDSWTAWISKDPLKVPLKDLALDWPETVEVFQRRNVILHHGGLVSKRYVDRVFGGESALSIGTELPIDAVYVDRAIDLILVLGVRTCQSIADRTGPPWLNPREVTDLLVAGRWAAAEALAESGERSLGQHDGPDEALLRHRCERWFARGQLHGSEAIRAEVADWDTSALRPLFRVARCALLSDLDGAFAILPHALESGEVSRRDLLSWPVLEILQTDPRLDELTG